MSVPIARYYDATKNPDGAYFEGVPLRDITEDEWIALEERQQAAIEASPFYRKTKPPADKAPKEEE